MEEFIGLDVSKEETSFCVVDKAGKVLSSGKTFSDPEALFCTLKEKTFCPGRIVLETGTLSNWLARGLRAHGLPVDIIDARQAHAVMKLQHNKTDANDARLLAEIARTGFCRPVSISSEEAQHKRILLKSRQHLIRLRRDTENTVRGLLCALGIRFPTGSGKLLKRVREALQDNPGLSIMIEPLLDTIENARQQTERLDIQVTQQAKHSKQVQLLMSIPGVGPLSALGFIATIDDATRFKKSRDVGAYLGLTSRRYQSGEMDYSGRISKKGDGMLRSFLFEAANSLLTCVRKAHPLKDWARRLRRRSSHKKACVALARKLAVIMHKMLITGETFRWPETGVGTTMA